MLGSAGRCWRCWRRSGAAVRAEERILHIFATSPSRPDGTLAVTATSLSVPEGVRSARHYRDSPDRYTIAQARCTFRFDVVGVRATVSTSLAHGARQ